MMPRGINYQVSIQSTITIKISTECGLRCHNNEVNRNVITNIENKHHL